MNNFSTKACLIVAVAVISTGCAARYGCKAPEGKSCSSISQVYDESMQEAISEKKELETPENIESDDNTEISSVNDIELNFTPVAEVTASSELSGSPVKSAPRVLRIWLAPWEDNDGDLHQPGYIYLQIDNGKWIY